MLNNTNRSLKLSDAQKEIVSHLENGWIVSPRRSCNNKHCLTYFLKKEGCIPRMVKAASVRGLISAGILIDKSGNLNIAAIALVKS